MDTPLAAAQQSMDGCMCTWSDQPPVGQEIGSEGRQLSFGQHYYGRFPKTIVDRLIERIFTELCLRIVTTFTIMPLAND